MTPQESDAVVAITKRDGTAKFTRGDGKRFLVRVDVTRCLVAIREVGGSPHESTICLADEFRRHCQELLPAEHPPGTAVRQPMPAEAPGEVIPAAVAWWRRMLSHLTRRGGK